MFPGMLELRKCLGKVKCISSYITPCKLLVWTGNWAEHWPQTLFTFLRQFGDGTDYGSVWCRHSADLQSPPYLHISGFLVFLSQSREVWLSAGLQKPEVSCLTLLSACSGGHSRQEYLWGRALSPRLEISPSPTSERAGCLQPAWEALVTEVLLI